MTRIEQTQNLVIHSSMMNPDEEHDEHNILMVRMFTQIFK